MATMYKNRAAIMSDLKRHVMDMMHRIEFRRGALFSEFDPALEGEIFAAIDADSIPALTRVLNEINEYA